MKNQCKHKVRYLDYYHEILDKMSSISQLSARFLLYEYPILMSVSHVPVHAVPCAISQIQLCVKFFLDRDDLLQLRLIQLFLVVSSQ